ncbi:MAG: transposon-encoded TnpW family protein [Oscillospiraceae bacterium]|nr:transposon-encoded TnpW family protein [Oscillospiraceae bacterium]
MDNKTVTETRIGNVTYIVTSECSPTATETVEKKLERLILRHVSDKKSYQNNTDLSLAMCADKSEYVTYQ